jgi:hypothetical protein
VKGFRRRFKICRLSFVFCHESQFYSTLRCGKTPILLTEQSDPAFVDGGPDLSGRIQQNLPIEHHASASRFRGPAIVLSNVLFPDPE